MDSTASAMTTAVITTTTRISTSVKPLLRTVRHRHGGASLPLIERRGADVGVVTFATRLAVAPVADDVVVAAVGAGARILIEVVPGVLGQRGQIASGAVIGDGGIIRLRN